MHPSAELKHILSADPIAAVSKFSCLVLKSENEDQIDELCQIMANYIRHSSVYKRKLVYLELQKSSLLCRLYLSFQFKSFEDTMFPRRLIFSGKSVFKGIIQKTSHRRHHLLAVGSNKTFNLGVQSDGSPVGEPRLVLVPHKVTRIEMSNTHTIFLTADNRLFGCGKAASFVPDCQMNRDSSYVPLPSEIVIPGIRDDEKVSDVRVTEGGSQFLVGDTWYFVGKRSQFPNSKSVLSNCSVSTGSIPSPAHEYQVAHVPLDESRVKIYIKLINEILYWDRSPDFNAKKELAFIVNGFPISVLFSHFQVLDNGEVYGTKNGLLKGKLRFWKNLDDGFIVKSGTVLKHFDTKFTLMALMEEVPGSIGTEFFAVSPDGSNLIMKMGYQKEEGVDDVEKTKYKSLYTYLIIEEREKMYDPVDIPMDLTFRFHEQFDKVIEKKTNRLIFGMMYPELTAQIVGNELHFRHVVQALPPEGRLDDETDLRDTVFDIDLENPRHLPAPTDPNNEFVPVGTAPDMIWYLVSTEKSKVPCHKYILLLHSRTVGGMQRFQTNLTYGSYQLGEPVQTEVEIPAEAAEYVIRNALRGILNPATLYDLKAIELIECINFYDYHLMNEMFHDSFYVLMETVNDVTLHFLYELFESFNQNVIDGLVQRPYLLFDSISSIHPQRELLEQFVKAMGHYSSTSSRSRGTLCNYEPEHVVKYFLDLNMDFEDVVLKAAHEDFEGVLDQWIKEATRRKEEKKAERGRLNSHTYRPKSSSVMAMTTSPIPIGQSHMEKSFSGSLRSPPQSPSTFSMSPLTKSLPIVRPRNNSISNSLEDFPEMGSSPQFSASRSTAKGKSPGKRFIPKGSRMVKANQMLQPVAPNAWKASTSAIAEEEATAFPLVNFNEVVEKEVKLQKKITSGFQKIEQLAHIELEDIAIKEIMLTYHSTWAEDEAGIITVELLKRDVEEDFVWGNMPGRIQR